jgi:repressor LexA
MVIRCGQRSWRCDTLDAMHATQEKLLALADSTNLGQLTLRGIGELIGDSSPQNIKHHLLQLQKKGLLRINAKKKIVERVYPGLVQNSNLIAIPILGTANCGPAEHYAEEKIEGYLRVSARLLKKTKGLFAVKAEGSSMCRAEVGGEKIEDGDYLLIDGRMTQPKDRDIVLSVIDGMANIKRYYSDTENDRIILASESTKEFPPIFIHKDDNFLVAGKVVQVIKRPDLN